MFTQLSIMYFNMITQLLIMYFNLSDVCCLKSNLYIVYRSCDNHDGFKSM